MNTRATPGSWKKGQTGNPYGEQSRNKRKLEFERILHEEAKEVWPKIVKNQLKIALENDPQAVKNILYYCLPKPTETVQIEQEEHPFAFLDAGYTKERHEALRLILKETQEKVEALAEIK